MSLPSATTVATVSCRLNCKCECKSISFSSAEQRGEREIPFLCTLLICSFPFLYLFFCCCYCAVVWVHTTQTFCALSSFPSPPFRSAAYAVRFSLSQFRSVLFSCCALQLVSSVRCGCCVAWLRRRPHLPIGKTRPSLLPSSLSCHALPNNFLAPAVTNQPRQFTFKHYRFTPHSRVSKVGPLKFIRSPSSPFSLSFLFKLRKQK